MKTTILTVLVALAAAGCASEPKSAAYPPSNTTTTTGARTSSATAATATPTTAQPGRGATDPSLGTAGATWGGTPPIESGVDTPTVTTPPPHSQATTPPNTDPGPIAPSAKAGDETADGTDRDGTSSLSAIDQGNSKAELKITADIRKQMVVEKGLSQTAKNAKVITTGTKVTLRGEVKTEKERTIIESFARNANGVTEVDNQLVVKK